MSGFYAENNSSQRGPSVPFPAEMLFAQAKNWFGLLEQDDIDELLAEKLDARSKYQKAIKRIWIKAHDRVEHR